MVLLLMKKSTLDPLNPANYHPVSNLLSQAGIQRAAVEQLQSFLDDTSVFDPFQASCCPNCGSETPLADLTDDLCRQLNKVKSTLLFLLDLTEVFDTVSYEMLTHGCANVGICRVTIQ